MMQRNGETQAHWLARPFSKHSIPVALRIFRWEADGNLQLSYHAGGLLFARTIETARTGTHRRIACASQHGFGTA